LRSGSPIDVEPGSRAYAQLIQRDLSPDDLPKHCSGLGAYLVNLQAQVSPH